MGCAQSTVKDQVQDTTATPEPVVDAVVASAPASTDLQFHAAEEAAVVPVETPVEEVAVPVEEVAAPVEQVVVPAEEAAAPTEEETAAPVVAEVTEEAAAAPVEDAAPVEEAIVPAVVADEPVVAEVEVVAQVEIASAAEPENETTSVDEAKTADHALVFVSTGVTFGDKGVAYYNFQGTNPEDPAQDVKISKRFNDFKTLHADIAAIMANESNVAPEHQDKFKTYPSLPSLPKTSLFRGRSNTKQTEEREAQFLTILNAIARHPIAVESAKFKAFLA